MKRKKILKKSPPHLLHEHFVSTIHHDQRGLQQPSHLTQHNTTQHYKPSYTTHLHSLQCYTGLVKLDRRFVTIELSKAQS